MSIYLSLQAMRTYSVHEVKYALSVHQEVCWLHRIMTDPRCRGSRISAIK